MNFRGESNSIRPDMRMIFEQEMYETKGDTPRLDRVRGNMDIYYEIKL